MNVYVNNILSGMWIIIDARWIVIACREQLALLKTQWKNVLVRKTISGIPQNIIAFTIVKMFNSQMGEQMEFKTNVCVSTDSLGKVNA